VADGGILVPGAGAAVIVSGAGAQLNLSNFSLSLSPSQLQILNGGKFDNASLDLSLAGLASLTASGVGSILAAKNLTLSGFSTDRPTATFSDHATGAFSGVVSLTRGLLRFQSSAAVNLNGNNLYFFEDSEFRVESGAVVNVAGRLLYSGPPYSRIVIDGVGSTLTINSTDHSGPDNLNISVTGGGTFSMPNRPLDMFSVTDLVVENGTLNLPQGAALAFGTMTIGGGGTSHIFGDFSFDRTEIVTQGAGTRVEFHGAVTCLPHYFDGNESLFAGTGDGKTVIFHGPVTLDNESVRFQYFQLSFGSTSVEFHQGLSLGAGSGGTLLTLARTTFGPENVLSLGIAGEDVSGGASIDCDRLQFGSLGSTLQLGGTLKIVLKNAVVPQIGDSWSLFSLPSSSGAVVGNFTAFDLPALPAGRVWDVSEITTTGYLSVKAATPLDQWRLDKFGTAAYNPEAGNLADPDNDGIVNLLEYALGLDPKVAITSLPTVSLTTVGPNKFLTLTFTRKLSTTDVKCEVQSGPAPDNLLPGSHYGAGGDLLSNANTTQVSRTIGATTETIVVRDNTPFSSTAARFMRLSVTHPP
jgi:hypothetical protein